MKNLIFKNEEEKFYNLILSKTIPKIYLEDFSNIMKSYIKYFPLPKAYFTQNYFVPHQKRLLLNYLKEKS